MNQFLLVDGYNVINAWPKLKKIGRTNLEEARDVLIQELVDYKHYTGYHVMIVFDAHYVKGGDTKSFFTKGVEVIFTKEHQTADSYIEKKVEELMKNRRNFVMVATSDWAEQQVVLGSGAVRISARELKIELDRIVKKIHKKTAATKQIRSTLQDRIDKEIVEKLEKWRRNQ
ncbi:NYN domain-containing protein [Crassaminicella profunda]|uniref:NYN domain-containing protein n=1 Tax=Crassaminicella profunda TaxID=1286698 RepID=UPI001CA671EC|nr:NYN domain-containing protein [Crassaminicella profunda]QZY54645.1 NYN domain-containing protein [Crassaminicella profunda]